MDQSISNGAVLAAIGAVAGILLTVYKLVHKFFVSRQDMEVLKADLTEGIIKVKEAASEERLHNQYLKGYIESEKAARKRMADDISSGRRELFKAIAKIENRLERIEERMRLTDANNS